MKIVLWLMTAMSLLSQNVNLFGSQFSDKMVLRFNNSGELCEAFQYSDGSVVLNELPYTYINSEKWFTFPPYTWICFPDGVVSIAATLLSLPCPTNLEPGIYDLINDIVLDLTTADFSDFCNPPLIKRPDTENFNKGSCTCGGKFLAGKVRMVSYGEEFKVRVVSYAEDVTVVKQFSLSLQSRCGEWQFVEYGENFTVRFVEYDEDFSIRFRQY